MCDSLVFKQLLFVTYQLKFQILSSATRSQFHGNDHTMAADPHSCRLLILSRT